MSVRTPILTTSSEICASASCGDSSMAASAPIAASFPIVMVLLFLPRTRAHWPHCCLAGSLTYTSSRRKLSVSKSSAMFALDLETPRPMRRHVISFSALREMSSLITAGVKGLGLCRDDARLPNRRCMVHNPPMMTTQRLPPSLTPLGVSLAMLLDNLARGAPRELALAEALGCVAAEMPPLGAVPARDVAAVDGFALRAR